MPGRAIDGNYLKPLVRFAGAALARFAQARSEIAWVLAGQVLSFAGGFFAIKLLTVLLGPQGYGRFALGLTLAGLCNMFVYGPLSQALLRFYSICRERGEIAAYFTVADNLYAVIGAGFVALAAAAGVGVRLALDASWAQLVLAALAVGVIAGTNGYLITVLSARRMRRAVALLQALDAWLKPLVAFFVLWLEGPDPSLALLAFFLGTLAVTAVQWLRQGGFRPPSTSAVSAQARRRLRGELLGYGASLGVFSFFGAISAYSDRWIALGLAGEHDLGVYAAMYQIANVPFVVLLGVVMQLITPALYDRAGEATAAQALERSDRLLNHTIAASAILMAAFVFAAWALARPALLLLTTAQFAQRSELLAPIVLALAIFQLGQLYTLRGMYHNRPSIYFWAKALQALALVGCGLVCTRLYGLVGLVIALTVSSVLYLGAVLFANRRLSAADPLADTPPLSVAE